MNLIPSDPERERQALCWVHWEHPELKVPTIYHFLCVICLATIEMLG